VTRSAHIQIGELSRRTGCNIETIRYYERIALLPKPARSTGRYRLYENADALSIIFRKLEQSARRQADDIGIPDLVVSALHLCTAIGR
jgi:DNA-binding transcriptional MerR regulator